MWGAKVTPLRNTWRKVLLAMLKDPGAMPPHDLKVKLTFRTYIAVLLYFFFLLVFFNVAHNSFSQINSKRATSSCWSRTCGRGPPPSRCSTTPTPAGPSPAPLRGRPGGRRRRAATSSGRRSPWRPGSPRSARSGAGPGNTRSGRSADTPLEKKKTV